MGSIAVAEALGGERCAEQVGGGFDTGFRGSFSGSCNFADGFEAGPWMALLEPVDIGGDDAETVFDPAAIAIDSLVLDDFLGLGIIEEPPDIGVQRVLNAIERQRMAAAVIDNLPNVKETAWRGARGGGAPTVRSR